MGGGHPANVNKASSSAIRGQWRAEAGIPGLEATGFTAVAQDEAIITHEAGAHTSQK